MPSSDYHAVVRGSLNLKGPRVAKRKKPSSHRPTKDPPAPSVRPDTSANAPETTAPETTSPRPAPEAADVDEHHEHAHTQVDKQPPSPPPPAPTSTSPSPPPPANARGSSSNTATTANATNPSAKTPAQRHYEARRRQRVRDVPLSPVPE